MKKWLPQITLNMHAPAIMHFNGAQYFVCCRITFCIATNNFPSTILGLPHEKSGAWPDPNFRIILILIELFIDIYLLLVHVHANLSITRTKKSRLPSETKGVNCFKGAKQLGLHQHVREGDELINWHLLSWLRSIRAYVMMYSSCCVPKDNYLLNCMTGLPLKQVPTVKQNHSDFPPQLRNLVKKEKTGTWRWAKDGRCLYVV